MKATILYFEEEMTVTIEGETEEGEKFEEEIKIDKNGEGRIKTPGKNHFIKKVRYTIAYVPKQMQITIGREEK